MVFVVSGPSGCGKSTLIGLVRKELPDLRFSVSHTTRPPRPSERNGVNYHFVSDAAFERMIQAGRFVEWARVHGHLYGTSRAELEKKGRGGDVLLDIDVQGARQVRRKVRGAVRVFIMPPVFDELRRRLLRRKEDSPEEIDRRLRNAAGEVKAYREFDYVIVNDDRDAAAAELKAVILAARARTGVRTASLRPILRSFAGRSIEAKPRRPRKRKP